MAKKHSFMTYTKAERDVMPTVYAVCPKCHGWTMVAADDPNDTKAGRKWVDEAIGNAVRRGNEIKRTTAAEFRALPIEPCECMWPKEAKTEPEQGALFEPA